MFYAACLIEVRPQFGWVHAPKIHGGGEANTERSPGHLGRRVSRRGDAPTASRIPSTVPHRDRGQQLGRILLPELGEKFMQYTETGPEAQVQKFRI